MYHIFLFADSIEADTTKKHQLKSKRLLECIQENFETNPGAGMPKKLHKLPVVKNKNIQL